MVTLEQLCNGYNLIESICSKLERDFVQQYRDGDIYPNYEYQALYEQVTSVMDGSYAWFLEKYANNLYYEDNIEEIASTAISLFIWGTNRFHTHTDTIIFNMYQIPDIINVLEHANNVCIFNKLQKLYWENPANFKQIFSNVNI